MRLELNSLLNRWLSFNLEAEGWLDRMLFSLDGEEQCGKGLSLEQKFELVASLVESFEGQNQVTWPLTLLVISNLVHGVACYSLPS